LQAGNTLNLTDDEAGMLYWLREFPNRDVTVDATIWKLIAKGLVSYEDGRVSVTAAGVLWPDTSRLN
jgi:hypothetical protein